MSTLTRSQFLRADFAGQRVTIRPPWSVDEAQFQLACTRCKDCVAACPEAVLRIGRGGFPEITFEKAGCTYCGACAESCRSGAILRVGQVAAWGLKAQIDDSCIALQGVVCRSCGDFCDTRAIRFNLRAGVVANPIVDASRCNGCGACVAPCPVKAVRVVDCERQTAPA